MKLSAILQNCGLYFLGGLQGASDPPSTEKFYPSLIPFTLLIKNGEKFFIGRGVWEEGGRIPPLKIGTGLPNYHLMDNEN